MKTGIRRVLFIVANIRVSNGVTSVIMNHYDKLLKEGYQVDFCAMYDRESPYLEKVKEHGNYYILPQKGNEPDREASSEFMDHLIRDGKYDIVHTHIVGRYAVMATSYAKKYKVPYRIFHSHNPRNVHDLHSLFYTLFYDTQCIYNSNCYLACSQSAGKSMFGKRRFSVIRNTIDTGKIHFSETLRKEERTKWNISDSTIVIGTVCRQNYQKNPFFLVDVFAEVFKKNKNVKLLWAGTGELEQQVKEYAIQKQVSDQIIFMGNYSDMISAYSAMDVFLLPSRFEGLGIVYIEAQACGLPTFASDVVPEDTKVTELIQYISLKEAASAWGDEILEWIQKNTNNNREDYAKVVMDAGYDRSNNNDLCEYYAQLFERE